MAGNPTWRRVAIGVSIGAATAVASTANAELHPTTLRIQVSDGFDSGQFVPEGNDLGNGVYNYSALGYSGGEGGDWNMDWDFNAIPFDADNGSANLSSNFVVRNNSAAALDFSIMMSMPLLGPAAAGNSYFGSAAITIENGIIASVGNGRSIWNAMLDGAQVDDIFEDPYVLDGTSSTNDDGGSIFGTDHGGASASLNILIAFTLSPGADMTMTGGFGILGATPAPGALALIGLGALAPRRRRR